MRRYKLAVHILVILSVFNFMPALAGPVPVQEVREACADVADEGEDVVIVSGKRAEEGQDPGSPGSSSGSGSWYYEWTPGSQDSGTWRHVWTPGSQVSGSMSVQLSTSPQHPPGSPSASDDANQLPSGEMQKPPYASGGTELPWYSKNSGGVNQVQPGTMNKLQPASSVRTKRTHGWPRPRLNPCRPRQAAAAFNRFNRGQRTSFNRHRP
jgi:hypothetical protein